MPFRHIQNAKVRAAMARACDLARASLNIDGADPRSGKLANLIVQFGENESDPERLADLILEELRKSNKKKLSLKGQPTS
jgi:hypothetical protein